MLLNNDLHINTGHFELFEINKHI